MMVITNRLKGKKSSEKKKRNLDFYRIPSFKAEPF